MNSAASASRFASAVTAPAKDQSSGKTIITGDSGVGKTYFLSTIEADDGRSIFVIPIEEGLKGASPLHSPATFTDGHGNPIVPASFGELVDALTMFRDRVNIPRMPDTWFDGLPYAIGSAERSILGNLVEAFPSFMPPSVLAQRGVATANLVPALERLVAERRVVQHNNSYRVVPDRTWRRPHLHLGIDSLSGIERLIHTEVTGTNGVRSMADKEYNQLWIKAQPLWQQVQDLLDDIRRKTGAHVWIVAHCIEDIEASPGSGEIYKARDLMLKGAGKTLVEIRQFWRQWADSVWYIMRDVEVRKGDKTRRTMATHRGRKLVTSETAQCKAKSRLAIPPVLPAVWNDVKQALRAQTPAPPERLAARILTLLPQLDAETAAKVGAELEQHRASVQHLSALLSRVEGLVLCLEDARGESGEGTSDVPPENEERDKAEGQAGPAASAPPETIGDEGAMPPPEGGM